MRIKHVLGKCTVWVVLSMLLVTSCAAPIQMKIEESEVDNKILTDGGYFYYQGKSYKYNTVGVKVIESLTQDIPEAKLEIESYREISGKATILRGLGLGIWFVGIIYSETGAKRNVAYTYEERERKRKQTVLIFSAIGFVGMMLGDAEGRKAIISLKRAIMYYNKSIDTK